MVNYIATYYCYDSKSRNSALPNSVSSYGLKMQSRGKAIQILPERAPDFNPVFPQLANNYKGRFDSQKDRAGQNYVIVPLKRI